MRARVSVLGHFGEGETLLNGQTVKTKIVTEELQNQLGQAQTLKFDTHGGWKTLLKAPFQVIKALKSSDNVIIFPAQNGLRVYAPLLSYLKKFYKGRKIHYVVIGGWLTKFTSKLKYLAKALKGFDGIYVETNTMKTALEAQGFKNIYLMPNCKALKVLSKAQLTYPSSAPYKLCTFSRVMKEKGIDELFLAMKELRKKYGDKVVLDIVGFFEDEYKELIQELCSDGVEAFHGFKEDPRPFYERADCVVLPSWHEGMSNVLLEAAAMGRPLITCDIPGCREAVEDGKTGLLCKPKDAESLYRAMCRMADTPAFEREKMGILGRRKMENEFSREKVVEKSVKVLLG